MSAQDTSHIYQSLFANLAITAAKGAAAAVTGSGAMLAETIHTLADSGNQLLLLVGVKSAARPPDARHPLGYGRELYFWSFIVALMLFLGGGVFSVYEGLHKLAHPEPLGSLRWAVGILLFSMALEGWSAFQNVVELNRRRGKTPFWRYLGDTKDSDLVVVFAENSAAVVGLVLALGALGAAALTGDPAWDAAGSVAVGLVLVAVSVFLAAEVKSLLLGESADLELASAVVRLAAADPLFERTYQIIAVQQGPGEALVALKAAFPPDATAAQLSAAIDAFEERLRAERPDAKWIFVEPDLDGGV